MTQAKLFDEEFLKKLEYLYLLSKKVFSGKFQAQTHSKKIGWGMEFADYRSYNPGDDLRYLDWNLYSRMEQLVTKLFHEEENLNVYFLLDVTRSMNYGHPKKDFYAKRVVAALAYIALANLDSVHILPFEKDLMEGLSGVRGKGRILKIFEFLENVPTAETTLFADVARRFVTKAKTRGLVVVVSDFFSEPGFEDGLKIIAAGRFDLTAIMIHHHYEAFPKYRGAMEFIDSETGVRVPIQSDAKTLKIYETEYRQFVDSLRNACFSTGSNFFRTFTEAPFEDLILRLFREGQFVK